ncbi:MAG: HigA family addiction module antidote protein [Candidatus Riflebacteria bacterium]|nr:HigA family addiction module antidote protein [Candidatus Riflebacteria bacterium]
MIQEKLPIICPGEILKEEFLDELNLSEYRLAKEIGVPARRINEIVHGKRAITADTAIRLARYFSTTPEFWMNLQSHYELDKTREMLNGKIDRDIKPYQKAA